MSTRAVRTYRSPRGPMAVQIPVAGGLPGGRPVTGSWYWQRALGRGRAPRCADPRNAERILATRAERILGTRRNRSSRRVGTDPRNTSERILARHAERCVRRPSDGRRTAVLDCVIRPAVRPSYRPAVRLSYRPAVRPSFGRVIRPVQLAGRSAGSRTSVTLRVRQRSQFPAFAVARRAFAARVRGGAARVRGARSRWRGARSRWRGARSRRAFTVARRAFTVARRASNARDHDRSSRSDLRVEVPLDKVSQKPERPESGGPTRGLAQT